MERGSIDRENRIDSEIEIWWRERATNYEFWCGCGYGRGYGHVYRFFDKDVGCGTRWGSVDVPDFFC